MKHCLVTSRILESRNGEKHAAVSEALISFLLELGFSAIPVSTWTADLSSLVDLFNPDLIVMSGGDSLGVHPERDKFEYDLLLLAESRGLPVLGICRGMQVLGTSKGANLKPIEGHIGTRHEVTGIFTKEVNSFHSFGFIEPPIGFETLARSNDGYVEAFRSKSLGWVGLMWHPEREKPIDLTEGRQVMSLLGIE